MVATSASLTAVSAAADGSTRASRAKAVLRWAARRWPSWASSPGTSAARTTASPVVGNRTGASSGGPFAAGAAGSSSYSAPRISNTDSGPPSANPNQIQSVCRVLEQAAGSLKAKTAIDSACRRAGETLGQRGLVCLVSDLLVDDPAAMMRALIHLTHRRHDVMVIHVLDDEELTFPFQGNTRFVAMEEVGELTGEGRTLRDGYMAALDDFLRFVQRECVSHRIDYARVNTSDNLGAVLARFLARREALGRRSVSKRR